MNPRCWWKVSLWRAEFLQPAETLPSVLLVRPGLADHFQSGLVDDIQQVFGVHGQSVSGRQHLLLVLLLQAGHDVLLGQLHLVNELGQIRVEQLLRHLDLQREDSVSWGNRQESLRTEPTAPSTLPGVSFWSWSHHVELLHGMIGCFSHYHARGFGGKWFYSSLLNCTHRSQSFLHPKRDF